MTRTELEEMTKDDLINYADDRDIEVHHAWLKDDIVSAILKGEKAAAKTNAAPVEQSSEPATADDLVNSVTELVKWMEEAGYRDHPLVIKAKSTIK